MSPKSKRAASDKSPAVKLKYRKTLVAATESVHSLPKQYRPEIRDNMIPFLTSSGEPNCIVGHTLHRLGVVIPQKHEFSSVKKLLRSGIIKCNDDTLELLMAIQDSQDDGNDPKEALAVAKASVADKHLPW